MDGTIADLCSRLSDSNFDNAETVQFIRDYFTSNDGDSSSDSDYSDDENEIDRSSREELVEDVNVTEALFEGGNIRLCSNDVSAYLEDANIQYASSKPDRELESVRQFACSCRLYSGEPCYQQFSPEAMTERRLNLLEMTSGMSIYHVFNFTNCTCMCASYILVVSLVVVGN